MNSPSSRTHRSSVLLRRGGGLLLVITAPSYKVAAFSTSRGAFSNRPLFVSLHDITACPRSIRASDSARRRVANYQRTSLASSTATAPTPPITYLDSLNSITSNPDLFPNTSDYIQNLQRVEINGSSAASVPSAEEFLCSLSTELLRASRNNEVVFRQHQAHVAVSSRLSTVKEGVDGVGHDMGVDVAPTTSVESSSSSDSSNSSPLYSFAELTAPAFASAACVGAAAYTYDPAAYTELSGLYTDIMSTEVDGINSNSVENDITTNLKNGQATEFAATATENEVVNSGLDLDSISETGGASGATVVGDNVITNSGGAASEIGDVSTLADAATAGDNDAISSVQPVDIGDAANSLADPTAAASTTMAEDAMNEGISKAVDGGYAASDIAAGATSTASDAAVGTTDIATDITSSAASTASNVGVGTTESFAEWHKGQGGSNALRDLASTIPTDELSQQQEQGMGYDHASMSDTVTAAMNNNVNDYYGNSNYIGNNGLDFGNVANAYASTSLEFGDAASAVGGGGGLRELAAAIPIDELDQSQVDVSLTSDLLGGVNTVKDYVNSAVSQPSSFEGVQQSVVPMVQDSVQEVAAASSVGSGFDANIAVASTPIEDVTTAASPMVDQAAIVPEVNNELSNSLASQLSDLNYDGLQIDGKTAASKAFTSVSPSVKPHADGLLSDQMKTKFDQFELPQYHIELPRMTNPFTEVSPSVQNALSSVKEASGASKEKLGNLFNTMSHSLDGLTDKVADVTNSFESLSGQVSKVAGAGTSPFKSIGDSVQSSASKVAELKPPNLNIEVPTLPTVNLPRTNLPEVNMQPPSLPSVNFPQPNLPSVDIHPPALPNLNAMEGTNAAVQRLGDSSLSEFGNAVLSAIKFTGGIIVKFLDLILNAIAGTSVSVILANAQASVTSVIDNASHAVVSTITNIGNMSLIEIIQHLMALVIAITDILLKIMNAVVYIISGKDGAEWALQATSAVNEASSQLLAQATTTYDHFTHASFTDLAHSVNDYSQYVGNEFVTLIGSLNAADITDWVSVSIPQEALDTVATTVQTALSM